MLVGARVGLRRLLMAGNELLLLGSAASAAAPSLIALAAAQVMVGAGAGLLISGGLAAGAIWAPAGREAKSVARASLGQPASWVAGMPLIGLTADLGWRYAWLGVPLAAGLAGRRPSSLDLPTIAPSRFRGASTRSAGTRSSSAGRSASCSATPAGAGRSSTQARCWSSPTTQPREPSACCWARAALAAFPGNFLVRRWLADSARELLIVLGLSAAAITAAFGTVRSGLLLSTGTFALLVLVATTRTVAGSAFALYLAPERRLAVMGVRASTAQLGHLLGGAAGGAALAAGGDPALGLTLAALFAL